MRNILYISLVVFVFLSGCSAGSAVEQTPTPTPPAFYTATLAPTSTDRPSPTAAPPSITPTIAPLDGVVTAQVNLHAAPDVNQPSLGMLNYLDKVQIVGKDSSGKWLRIVYKDTPSGVAWVVGQFIQFKGDADQIPVVQAPPLTSAAPGVTSVAATATPSPRISHVTIKLNVRSGPASSNASLGMLDANTAVSLTGRNENNTWVQIDYPAGPDGKGWVAASYLQSPDLTGLPYYDNDGKLVYAPTLVANPGQPTPTATPYAAAAEDNDSETSPAVQQVFAPDGAGQLIYSSDLSAPTGDAADFVAFTPYGPSNQSTYVYMRLDCVGNGGVTASLELGGKPVQDSRQLVCGNYDFAMKVLGGQEYLLVLRADGSGGPLRYVKYTLTISATPNP